MSTEDSASGTSNFDPRILYTLLGISFGSGILIGIYWLVIGDFALKFLGLLTIAAAILNVYFAAYTEVDP